MILSKKKQLISKGGNINASNSWNDAVLHSAAEEGTVAVCKLLVPVKLFTWSKGVVQERNLERSLERNLIDPLLRG